VTDLQAPNPILSLHHLFSFRGEATEIVDFGECTTGKRLDIHFDGKVEGSRVKGRMRGIDHGLIRPDGVMQIDVRAVLTTEDGANISVAIEGFLNGEKIQDTNVRLSTGDQRYRWLAERPVMGRGRSRPDGRLEIDYYHYDAAAGP
jgi:hypothetical protein